MKIKKARKYKKTSEDIVYTKPNIVDLVLDIVDIYIPKNREHIILEPCIGGGAFYEKIKTKFGKTNIIDWCEIEKGKDFFKYDRKVGTIITNPPYSIYEEFLYHSMKIADNIFFLIPLSKAFTSLRRIKNIYEWGGIVKIWILPYTGNEVGFPHGFPIAIIWLQRGFKKSGDIIYLDNRQQNGGKHKEQYLIMN